MGPLDWIQGGQLAPPRISLNPAQRQSGGGGSLAKHGPPLQEIPRQIIGNANITNKPTGATPPRSSPAVVASGNGCNPSEVTNGIGSHHSPKLSTANSNGTTSNTNGKAENQLTVLTNLTETDGSSAAKEPR
jgi:hypothetical protein